MSEKICKSSQCLHGPQCLIFTLKFTHLATRIYCGWMYVFPSVPHTNFGLGAPITVSSRSQINKQVTRLDISIKKKTFQPIHKKELYVSSRKSRVDRNDKRADERVRINKILGPNVKYRKIPTQRFLFVTHQSMNNEQKKKKIKKNKGIL